MKRIAHFTEEPALSTSTFDWPKVADGDIYEAFEGEDYSSRRGFLNSMTQWANKNNYAVRRVEGKGSVQFSLTKKRAEVVDLSDRDPNYIPARAGR